VPYSILEDEEQQAAVIELEDLSEAVQAPLQRIEHNLHKWVAFAIIPLFALANAGVLSTPMLYAVRHYPLPWA
jgi:NhaA family Na+:H+ antiporter